MNETATQSTTTVAERAVAAARDQGLSGWHAYEEAKRYVKRHVGATAADYYVIIDEITDRLEI